MKDLVTFLTSTKGTAGNRGLVLAALLWLGYAQVENKAALEYLKTHRCECRHAAPSPYSAAPAGTNTVARFP